MSPPESVTPPRANVYIDGFNLYHGCFDDHGGRAQLRQYRWLDLGTMCAKLFPGYIINHIRYFTAVVDPRPDNPNNRARQLEYLRGLRTNPHLTVHQGRFATHVQKRKLADLSKRTATVPIVPIKEVYVIEEEEKGSDVNLASYMLVDGFREAYEVAIVVSNDSDLAAPIRLVRDELGLTVMVVNPRTSFAADLQGIADIYKNIRVWALRDSQFPTILADANGTITKPATW